MKKAFFILLPALLCLVGCNLRGGRGRRTNDDSKSAYSFSFNNGFGGSKSSQSQSQSDNARPSRSSGPAPSSISSYSQPSWQSTYGPSSSLEERPSSSQAPYSWQESSSSREGSSEASHVHVWNRPNKEELANYYAEIETSPTCTENGTRVWYCECGATRGEAIEKLGHNWGAWTNLVQATCYQSGLRQHTCRRCQEIEEETVRQTNHNYVAVGDAIEVYDEAKTKAVVYTCKYGCGKTYLSFRADEVSYDSSKHLVFEEPNAAGEVGVRFWGRSIGNAQALDENGTSYNQQPNECVYCSTETGDFFEYNFDLTAEQAALLGTCRLYIDAKPADYMNGGDFFAYDNSNDDWTPGYYIDGSANHIETDEGGNPTMVNDHAKLDSKLDIGFEGADLGIKVPLGKRVEDYRYVLYVDDVVRSFDSSIKNPTHGNNMNMTREEFVLPYSFNLHEGENKIRLCMAGGYRSTFYNFTFRPFDGLIPITVNESSLEIREGKTAQITSDFSNLSYASADTSIAMVSVTGLVTAIKPGTTTITVSKEGNYQSVEIPVTILEKEGVITLALADGVIAPEGGVEAYNSTVSGLWYRSFKKDATVTYTFNSELAGKFDIQLGLRGSNIVLEENIAVKVNNVDVDISGTINSSYNAVDCVSQANLIKGENIMVITAIADSNLYLKSLKLTPHQYVAFQTYSVEDLEENRTDSGWETTKTFGDSKAFKFNKVGSVTVSYTSESTQKAMLQLKIAVKYSNRDRTGFWEQNGAEKTMITINEVPLEAGSEPDFSGAVDSGVADNGSISTVVWYNIAEIDLIAGVNTIKIEYLTGGYSYYLGGIALAK